MGELYGAVVVQDIVLQRIVFPKIGRNPRAAHFREGFVIDQPGVQPGGEGTPDYCERDEGQGYNGVDVQGAACKVAGFYCQGKAQPHQGGEDDKGQ